MGIAGSIITMDKAVQNFRRSIGCTIAEALECATVHPAKVAYSVCFLT